MRFKSPVEYINEYMVFASEKLDLGRLYSIYQIGQEISSSEKEYGRIECLCGIAEAYKYHKSGTILVPIWDLQRKKKGKFDLYDYKSALHIDKLVLDIEQVQIRPKFIIDRNKDIFCKER